MNGRRFFAVLFAVIVLTAAAGHAHTLAGTIVSVVTRGDEVNITIAAEADPLIAKLEALTGVSASDQPTTSRDRRDRIASLFPALRARIDARVAGTPLVLHLQDVIVDDTAQTEIHVTAKMPARASTLTWRSTFIFGAYRLAITSGNTAAAIQWLQGPQTSTPVALDTSPQQRSGIGPGFAMAAVVVYVIGRRRAGRTRPAEARRSVRL